MSKKPIDPRDIKWFGPIWRRIAVLAALAVWGAREFVNGDQFWSMMVAVVAAYAVWKLFIDFPSAAEIEAFEAEQRAKAGSGDEPEQNG